MALVDVVMWRPEGLPVYAWRYPESNLSTFTQLIVAESQEAVLFSRGQMLGKFGPGKHTLNTENLPLLRSLYGIPFGGKNPFTSEVWFVNKLQPLTISWSTDAFRFHDPDYKTMIPLIARGRYGLKVTDAERFLKKLVGTAQLFTEKALTDHFLGELITTAKSSIAGTMQVKGIGIKSISSYLTEISVALKGEMVPFWEGYGFELVGFYVTSIDIDSQSPDGAEIIKAMAQQSAQSIAGYTWQQDQTFKTAKEALAGNTEIGFLGALALTGGGGLFGNSNRPNDLMQPTASTAGAPTTAAGQMTQAPIRQVFCSKCSKKYANTSKFCPFCGDMYNACPRCGSDNDTAAVRCVTCGAELKSTTAQSCSNCGKELPPGSSFCPDCGTTLQSTCPRCKKPINGKTLFCGECGQKIR
jgi:membrane protease subunit (stomatin/prohibitin family)